MAAPDLALDFGAAPPLHHAELLRGLVRAADARRLPHALLFTGARGVGKYRSARWLAMALLCKGRGESTDPCGACGACTRASAGSHGDLLAIDVLEEAVHERSEEIRIGRFVRRDESPEVVAGEFLSLRPCEGGWRIVIVREAERANVEAQNAILKALEEPGELVLWILECSQPAALLPTIVSRCVRIAFERLSASEVARVLSRLGVDAELAPRLARWSQGSAGDAASAWRTAGLEMRALIAEITAGRKPPLAASRELWDLEGEFEARTARGSERLRLRAFLDLSIAWSADVLHLDSGLPADELAHADAPELGLAGAAAARSTLEVLLDLRAGVERNVDPASICDRACLALADLAPRAAKKGAA